MKYPGPSFQYFCCFNDPSHYHALKYYICIEFQAYTFSLTLSPKLLTHSLIPLLADWITATSSSVYLILRIKLVFFLPQPQEHCSSFFHILCLHQVTVCRHDADSITSTSPWQTLCPLHSKPELTLLPCAPSPPLLILHYKWFVPLCLSVPLLTDLPAS